MAEATAPGPAATCHQPQGAVDLGSFRAQRAAGEAAIAAAEERIVIDFAHVEGANSLTVALMTAWYRSADRAGTAIRFDGLSPALQQIVDFSGLTAVLPIAGPADGQAPDTGTAQGAQRE